MPAPVINPVPDDFAPLIQRRGDTFFWSQAVTVEADGSREQVQVEIGLRDGPGASEAMRHKVWAVLEYARLGRPDLFAHARKDRHRTRPTTPPEFAPQP